MGEPIRSDVLAAMLKFLIGGEGSGYSLPIAEWRGLTVLSQNATPHTAEHERMHIAAGRNAQRNDTIDTMEFIPPLQRTPWGGPRMTSPEMARRQMDADAERENVKRRAMMDALRMMSQMQGQR